MSLSRWAQFIDEEKEDLLREKIMNDVYGVDVKVYCQFWGDPKVGLIDKYYCRFVTPKGKEYKIEELLDGNNATKEIIFGDEKFSRYIDAELKLVELVRGE